MMHQKQTGATNQTVTSGATATVTNYVNNLFVNPASVLATHTLTLCPSPYNNQITNIYFGGTVTEDNTVVTLFTLLPNAGHTLSVAITNQTMVSGECITLRYVAATLKWHLE
jgi:hypothetical protein